MAPIQLLQARDNGLALLSPLQANLVITLIALLLTGTFLTLVVLLLRGYRRRIAAKQNANSLPSHLSPQHSLGHRRSMTINTAGQGDLARIVALREKEKLLEDEDDDEESSRPSSPVPQIHITFPEEEDWLTGRRQSARVIVTTINEKGGVVGLEPYTEEEKPSLIMSETKAGAAEFKFLDLDTIGGLREKPIARK